jgi:hypothetical protein
MPEKEFISEDLITAVVYGGLNLGTPPQGQSLSGEEIDKPALVGGYCRCFALPRLRVLDAPPEKPAVHLIVRRVFCVYFG